MNPSNSPCRVASPHSAPTGWAFRPAALRASRLRGVVAIFRQPDDEVHAALRQPDLGAVAEHLPQRRRQQTPAAAVQLAHLLEMTRKMPFGHEIGDDGLDQLGQPLDPVAVACPQAWTSGAGATRQASANPG